MSDSEDHDAPPSDAQLEQALRAAVASTFKRGTFEDLTVKRVRIAVEQELGLPDGFFKSHARWKERSKEVIEAEVVCIPWRDSGQGVGGGAWAYSSCAMQTAQEHAPEPSPKPTKREAARKPVAEKRVTKAKVTQPKVLAKAPAKVPAKARQSTAAQETATATNPSKRRKIVEASDSDAEVLQDAAQSPEIAESDEDVVKGRRPRARVESKRDADGAGQDGEGDEEHAKAKQTPDIATSNHEAQANDSSSELSELLDEAPAPKKRRKKSSPTSRANVPTKSKASKAAKPKDDQNLDPNEAEIKRLQGWLVKCGIRKLWHRELAGCDSAQAKVRHLKGMLKEAGMDGRYSADKARQIKEQRELMADLEAVQEGAKRWGQEASEGEGEAKPPKRRLAKGLREVAFLGSDGEETD